MKKEALRKAGVGYFEVKSGDKPEDVRRIVMQMVEVQASQTPWNERFALVEKRGRA